MDLEQIQELVADAESSTSETREEASNMLVFGRITQWDDELDDVATQFRGTFDLIKPQRNRIISELWANPIDITFKPKDGAEPDTAEILTGMYRTDMMKAEEAMETAQQDQVDCGFGAFRFVTEYESKEDDLNNYQRVCVEPIAEANNVVYFDSNAKRKDKSDAKWCCILSTFTKTGWADFCKENGINYEDNKEPATFKTPNRTNSYFWRSKQGEIKIGEFYYREKKRERVLIFEDPLGQVKSVYQRDIKEALDELDELGFVKVGEKYKDKWTVYKKIVTGEKELKKQRIAGEYIPVIPVYGDHSRVEGREIWRGIYHDAQDPQRLHNFIMSYTASAYVKSPVEKPTFYDGQIQGKEVYWTQAGDHLPYRLVNEVSPVTGAPYPAGPIEYSKPPQIPQGAAALIEMTRRAVTDVTGSTLDTEQMLSGQVTEGQIGEVKKSQNMETFLYQNNFALAMKHAGCVYASIAAEIYDIPREVTVTNPDGTETEAMIMESVFDDESGEMITINDITKGRFEVYADPGPSFQSQKEQARAEMERLYGVTAGTPEGNLILLSYLMLLEGPKTDHLRDWARNQLILQGLIEPDTDEEKAMLQQANQPKEPDAATLMGMAEMLKAQSSAKNDADSNQIDAYNAETKRMEAISKAQKLGVESSKIGKEITGTELDNLQKLQQAATPATMRVH